MSASDVSAVTNFFSTPNEGFTTTLGSSISASAGTVPLNNVTNLVNGKVFVGIIEPGATNEQVFTGTVDVSGSQITGVVWTRGANVAHVGGVTIVDYPTGTATKMMVTGILKSLTQTGVLNSVALGTIYPVGCIYIETTGTNPNTTFGFGTWAAYGAGRTMIGVGTSDQAFAAAATGGESTHVLTTAEMPAHTHTTFGNTSNTGGNSLTDHNGGNNGINGYPTSSTGSGNAHNNLPPYIVTYFWRRTA